MTNVVRLEPEELGDGFQLDHDGILEANKGQGYSMLAIIGEKDGEVYINGSANAGLTLIMLEKAKLKIIGER